MKVLLLGRKGIVVEDVQNQINMPKVELFSGTNLEEVRSIFAENKIDHVIMGAGIELQERLNIIQIIFELSESTTVHMKDFASGSQGMLPFVSSILSGLQN